ncbi:hypothetical protein ABZ567_07145 [Streptomyces sp. NPDC016459]|uniref:hypothetical protein n=1 Tax=Streptomyces sp. NPDC016459 TaxID=3157190 RepID=UPI0033F07287
MADERYQWLDQESAERLLRGEPVDAVDDHARAGAERLARALDTARTPAFPAAGSGELPGEAAALAAFREATAERASARAAATDGAPHARTLHADLGRVRLTPVSPPRRRWGRSVRYGLAAAVAAVTVGGVAVAAGTGVLPLVGPAPASSVTAEETVDTLVSKEPGIREDPEAPPTRPGADGEPTPGVSPSAGTGTTTAPPTGGADGHGTATTGPGTPKPRSTAGTGKDSGGTGTDPGGTDVRPGGATSLAKTVKACRDYRTGRLDATGRKQLTNNLRGGESLRRYCDRILGGGTGAPEGGAKDETKDPKGDSGDDKDDAEGHPEGGSKDAPRGGGGNDGRSEDGSHGGRDDKDGGSRDSRAGTAAEDRRGTARSATDTVRLFAAPPLGTAVTARVPLAV